ncbi:MAG: UDP-glucose 4-epimerase GalE [Actinomycetota bacterium]
MARVLLTGGTGFIGSHTAVDLIERGHDVVLLDDLSNSSRVAVDRIAELTGITPPVVIGDLRDRAVVDEAFAASGPIDGVVHFAGMKRVRESVELPLTYHRVNVGGAMALLEAMGRHHVRRLIFSSSGSVYGDVDEVPIAESHPHAPSNPYSATKSIIERLLSDVADSDPSWRMISLRYFNPAGAHPSGRLGEVCSGAPTNLLPILMEVATGQRAQLSIFGDDFPTPDGTALRDYVHVCDVAAGHALAYEHLDSLSGHRAYNLGAGEGVSVRQLLDAVGDVVGHPLPHEVVDRAPGDVPALVGDVTSMAEELGWHPTATLTEICADAWRFTGANPDGYGAVS